MTSSNRGLLSSAGKNRHHYALFTHNCKLILLLRQEASTGAQMNVLKPAEWRWKPAAVCDDQWHHYAVVVDFPRVRRPLSVRLEVVDFPRVRRPLSVY